MGLPDGFEAVADCIQNLRVEWEGGNLECSDLLAGAAILIAGGTIYLCKDKLPEIIHEVVEGIEVIKS